MTSVRQSLDSISDIQRLIDRLPSADHDAIGLASERQQHLTKPAGSLGRLEELAVWLCGWGLTSPSLAPAQVLVFAGNHGVAAQRVSAYPTEVTAQMVRNFSNGGSAINQIVKAQGSVLNVLPLWLDEPTGDFTVGVAMSEDRFVQAVRAGFQSVPTECALLAVGEMGIGNTTSASALCAALIGGSPESWVGPGTGVGEAGIARKIDAVGAGVALHCRHVAGPFEIAAALGGHELAAMLGAVLAARLRRIPVLLDGFVATASVLPMAVAAPGALDHCKVAHVSAEPGHRHLIDWLGMRPILDMGMRLGEASGAALAIPIVQAAAACHFGMATFAKASVSARSEPSEMPPSRFEGVGSIGLSN